ncbi:MAG: DUF4352 domain-containing protein [Actinobacteria bacterium]|nr:DUF4352 domain-containing protein [Actinomycetota bacterium]
MSGSNLAHRLRAVASVLCGIAIVVALVASGESNTATKVESDGGAEDQNESGAPSTQDQIFRVGDLVEIGEWRIRVHKVTDPLQSSNEFIGPSDGNRWVAADLEVTNLSNSGAVMSTLMCLELQDSSNQNYSIAITAEDFPELDGDVAAGASRRGVAVFEVPQGASGLTLKFSCDIFNTGQASIRLN